MGATLDTNTSTGLIYNDLNSSTTTSVLRRPHPCPAATSSTSTTVEPISPTTLVTSLSGGGNTGVSINVPPTTPVIDSATLPGANTATAGGTVVYGVYSNSSCAAEVAPAGTVTVTNGVVPNSTAVTLAALRARTTGTPRTPGDFLNEPSNNACSEVESVALQPPNVATVVDDAALATTWNSSEVTGASAYDTATVTGSSGTPTGTVMYNCSRTRRAPVSRRRPPPSPWLPERSPNSASTVALGARTYSYEADCSGNSLDAGRREVAESFIVPSHVDRGNRGRGPGPRIGVVRYRAVGSAALDAAALTEVAGFVPSGTVVYKPFASGAMYRCWFHVTVRHGRRRGGVQPRARPARSMLVRTPTLLRTRGTASTSRRARSASRSRLLRAGGVGTGSITARPTVHGTGPRQ